MNFRWRDALLYGGLAILILLPRLPGLKAFATADEPYWLSMGANFYYALGQREFANTIYEYQPAVTTMWLVTGALLLYYPQYRGLGQGYLEFEKGLLDPFLLEHGKDPLVLLALTRALQVIILAGLLVLAFTLLRRLVGLGPALAASLMASFDPFFLGQSRLLDHEALLSCFVLISILSLCVYLFQGRRLAFLLMSAIAGALAQLTKSSAIVLLVPAGLLMLYDLYRNRADLRRALLTVARDMSAWLAVLVLAYVVFWPGMWVAPGKMLHQVYGNAFSYAFQGARLIALDQSADVPPGLDTGLAGAAGLVYTVFWRTTPVTWIGLLLAALLPFIRLRPGVGPGMRLTMAVLALTGLAFIAMFALARGRNSPHYMLASYVMFNLLAGMGWFSLFQWAAVRYQRAWLIAAGFAALVVFQAASVLPFYPYYFTYQDPLLAWLQPRQQPQFAYGEGLELAARYLADLPGARDSTALVYYSRGCFSYFFPGSTERFKPYFAEPGHEQELFTALQGADYLVLYPAVQAGLPKYARLFKALSQVEPLKEIWLDGYRYAVVYSVDSFPLDFYDILFAGGTG